MATAGLPATITVEFGFGSAPDAVSPTWTDVSAYVDLGPGLTITPGRTADRSSISPRRLSITLDNRDDRFNPRNASGPYYGDLVPRVPVRVRANYASTDYTLFRGFVDGGWPQDFMQQARTVPITAVDAVGWAATAPPPCSVYEGEIGALRDVEGATLLGWLRPQSDGTWRDMVSGHTFPHSAKFEKLDPIVDGDEEGGWSDVEGSGSALDYSEMVAGPEFSNGSPGLLVFWLSGTAVTPARVQLLRVQQGGNFVDVVVGSYSWGDDRLIEVGIGDGSDDFYRFDHVDTESGGQFGLLAGVHQVAYWSSGSQPSGRVWVDGTELPVVHGSQLSGTTTDYVTAIGRWVDNDIDHLVGCVDHITWWTDTDAWGCTVDEAVTRLFEAGRLARVGDSMDARMSWILGVSGWGLLGTLDASQIVTQQGYRRRNTVLELLQTIEDTEQGRTWVDREGRFRFSARSWPTADTVSNAVQATFGDTGTDLPYSAAMSRIVDDDRVVVNVAEVTREYGTMQRAENAASIAAYGRRSPLGLSNLLYANDRQSRAVADWMVTAHGEPQARVEVLTFQPVNEAATLVPLACQIEPGWLIRVKRDGYTFDAHVVDVGMRIGMATWDVSLNLDATRATDFTGFTWDDGTGTVGTPWDDGTGTTTGAKGWAF